MVETVFYERNPDAPIARCQGLLNGDQGFHKRVTIAAAAERKEYKVEKVELVATDGDPLRVLVKISDPTRSLLRRPMSLQDDGAAFTAFLVLAVLAGLGFLGFQYETRPQLLAAVLGWLAAEAWGGYVLIAFAYFALAFQVQNAMGKNGTVGSVIGIQFLAAMAFLLCGYWWYLTRDLAAPQVFPDDHVRYYESLKSRVAASPLFELMVLPLLLVIVRLIGLSALGTAFKGLIGFLKK
ncbi:MAG: hypothetical protein IPM60_17805 [Rhodospirillales bacterium]|nr:hypothetical protein [Rhodospirillales bacterium]